MMDMDNFVFPDDLDRLTLERLQLPPVPQDWNQHGVPFAGRVSGISFRKTGQLTFFLDGRKSGTCHLSAVESGWLDAGQVTALQIACHYAASRNTRFSRSAVQKTLFD